MIDIFRGYVATINKKCIQAFGNGEPLLSLEEAMRRDEFAGVLNGKYTVIDIDDMEAAKVVLTIVTDRDLNCRVYQTTRGYHFVFLNSEWMSQCHNRKINALGIAFDSKYGTNAYICVKFGGVVRKIIRDFDESREIDTLPKFFMEVKGAKDLFGMTDGSGRNGALFSHIIPLMKSGFSIEEARQTLRLINDYVFGEPLSESEFDKVTRDEAFNGVTVENDFADTMEWHEITPIDTINPPPFPLDCYPKTLCNYARALSEHTQTDPAMAGVSLLGVLGTIFQNKISVVSVNGNIEQTSIYAVDIAPPAERKSEVKRRITNPINKFTIRYNLEHKAELSRSKAQKKLLQKALAIAEKGDNADALFKAQEDYDNYHELQPLTLIADDTTVEALVSLMSANNERMLIASDEGGVFFHMKGRYKQNGDDTELYLKSHSGGRVSVHRKSREPEILENPALSLCISVQPYVVENSIMDEENTGRGLTARFLYAYCEERAGKRQAVSIPIPTEVEQAYENAILKCLSVTIESEKLLGLLGTDYNRINYIYLSEEATQYAIQYFDICEKRIMEGLERAKGWNGKAFGLSIRIAGLFHSFQCIEQDKDPTEIPIPLDIMINASKVVEVLAVHAEKVFMGNERKNKDAIYLLTRIKSLGIEEFNKQDLWQKVKRRFITVDSFDEVLQTLEESGYIKIEIHQTKGRPLTTIKVNPYINCT